MISKALNLANTLYQREERNTVTAICVFLLWLESYTGGAIFWALMFSFWFR